MNYLGIKIKNTRLLKNLTQAELADEICTQATISNLENNGSMPTLSILLAITKRLNIDISELSEIINVSDYIGKEEKKNTKILNQLRILCGQIKYQEAYDLLLDEINFDELKDRFELRQYYYYKGITSLLAKENFSDAHFNFNLSLSTGEQRELDFFDVLSANGIGAAYLMNSEEDKARAYFEKSLSQLKKVMEYLNLNQESLEIIKIYYNTAKFYSSVTEYQKAIELCTLGIALQKKQNMNFELDKLYYEKGFNLYKLDRKEEAEEYYYYAAALAKMDNHNLILEVIKKNMQKFNLAGYTYWK